MAQEPAPPFLVIRAGQAFWVQQSPWQEASATLQAFQEGCFRDACCYDATGGLWQIIDATLRESATSIRRTMPWQQVPVQLHLAPRMDVSPAEVVSRLAAVIRDDNEFCDGFTGASAPDVLKRFEAACTPADIIQTALSYE